MTKEELKITSKEALGKIKKLIFIIGEILVTESKQDISPKEAIQRIRKTCNKYDINGTNYETIKQDLEILYMLRKNMHVDTETFKDDNGKVEEYEYIAYNYWDLDIENKEEYNKLREWLLK